MENKKVCWNCGSPNLKTVQGGISKRTGKKFNTFIVCDECNKGQDKWPNSSQKSQNRANFANNNASNKQFEEIMAKLDELGFQLDNLEVLLKTNKEI